jgi:uncharacterized membrane-anchored protein
MTTHTSTGSTVPGTAPGLGRTMLNKVPEVTVYFWIIKVMATTVGETIGDFLTGTVGLTLVNASLIIGAVLVAVLAVQFRSRRYIPAAYWLSVVLISVVGTLITDHFIDDLGIALEVTTLVFGVCLAAAFAVWYASERTLSIHTIMTTRRESFYWLAILFTFAVGTAAGDLFAERLALGFAVSALIFAGLIGAVAVAHFKFNLNAVLAFWLAYILTRPLGASVGDLLSQAKADGGLGLGTTVTSGLFLAVIAATVTYLAITRRDVTENASTTA